MYLMENRKLKTHEKVPKKIAISNLGLLRKGVLFFFGDDYPK